MDRRRFLRHAGVGATGLLGGCCVPGGYFKGLRGRYTTPCGTQEVTRDLEDPDRYSNPVFEPAFPDPTVVRAEDGYVYAYGTALDWRDGGGLRMIPILRSRNLVDWEYVGEALPEPPDWHPGEVWAPDVHYDPDRDRYLLYYSMAVWGRSDTGIGVAVASDPAGPFDDRGKLFTSETSGVPMSIDPMVTVADGTLYLFWGSFAGIYGIALAPDGLSHAPFHERFRVEPCQYEASYLVERDGARYLFVSTGTCCQGVTSTYRVHVARADSLRSPYRNRDGDRLGAGHRGNLVVESGNGFCAPGHVAVLEDDAGTYWMLYHGYEADRYFLENDEGVTPRRTLLLDPLEWVDGFPRVADRHPSDRAPTPTFR